MEDIQPTLQVICISLIVISFLMLLGSFKWHKLADYMIYEEMLYQLVIAFIPNTENNFFDLYVATVCFLLFWYYYTGDGKQIIYIILVQICWTFIPQYLIFKESFTFFVILRKLLIALGQFFILSIFAMIFEYVLNLHQRMKTVNFENVKLLDGMHEGLIIV